LSVTAISSTIYIASIYNIYFPLVTLLAEEFFFRTVTDPEDAGEFKIWADVPAGSAGAGDFSRFLKNLSRFEPSSSTLEFLPTSEAAF